MKSLATLIKLQKMHVDEQRLQLAKVQEVEDRLQQALTALEAEKRREQQAASEAEGARQTYGAFLKNIINRERALRKELQQASRDVELARDKLSELFEEQKRYEIAEENRLKTIASDENRREKIMLDEIGSVSFERNTKK